jgi:hypothetical protein
LLAGLVVDQERRGTDLLERCDVAIVELDHVLRGGHIADHRRPQGVEHQYDGLVLFARAERA